MEEEEENIPSSSIHEFDGAVEKGKTESNEGISTKVELFYLALRYGATLTIDSQHYYELVDAICDLEDHQVRVDLGETEEVVRVIHFNCTQTYDDYSKVIYLNRK